MTTTDFIAALALLVSSGALALEVRRWFESGPRLHLSVMADAVIMPDNDGKKRFAVTVTNRGSTPTQITHLIIFLYRSSLHRRFGRPYFTALVPHPQLEGYPPTLPARLEVNGTWQGLGAYNDELVRARKDQHLYVGVHATHTSRPFLKRVQPERKLPTKEID